MITRRSALAAGAALLARPAIAASPEHWTIVTEYPASAISGEGIAFFAAAANRLGRSAGRAAAVRRAGRTALGRDA